jgi:hypothetical protein
MTLKRGIDGQQVVTFGPTEKMVFGIVTTLITSGILGLIAMQFRVTADIAAIKEQIKAVDRRVERVEDHK